MLIAVLFNTVFEKYKSKKPKGSIEEAEALLAKDLGCDVKNVYVELDNLLGKLCKKNQLHTYGTKEADIDGFTDTVISTQQRLLANNYVELTREEIREIYQKLF